ncbi:hypothetical protein DFR42_10734 [Undibacterium pigrum]|uniref:Transmembrane protein n=2 Tax=Undibacterium pigrum TaxID=401470 RepID=A0A318J2M3_9BURK|nr:hypothetical protein DFR42_10734 [Undibacterium pigrum]
MPLLLCVLLRQPESPPSKTLEKLLHSVGQHTDSGIQDVYSEHILLCFVADKKTGDVIPKKTKRKKTGTYMNNTTTEATVLLATSENASRAGTSGVSWGAVLGGAVAAAALSLILLMLGTGLGLSSVSPWSYNTTVIGISTIAWLAFTQLAASGIGGYIAGRLRTRWTNVHDHEVYFRDTAHGMLAWAVASLLTVGLLASAATSILGSAADAAGTAVNATATVAGNAKVNPVDYFTDMLLRADQATATTSTATDGTASNSGNSNSVRMEVGRILSTDIANGSLSPADRDYLARLVAKRADMTQVDATKRVDAVFDQLNRSVTEAKNSAKLAADQARKAAANSALWMFVALLLGAFVASLAATLGGRQRDQAHLIA